jgi:hypothetical protein
MDIPIKQTLEQKFPVATSFIKASFKARRLFGCDEIFMEQSKLDDICLDVFMDEEHVENYLKNYDYWNTKANKLCIELDKLLIEKKKDTNVFISTDDVFNEKEDAHKMLGVYDSRFRLIENLVSPIEIKIKNKVIANKGVVRKPFEWWGTKIDDGAEIKKLVEEEIKAQPSNFKDSLYNANATINRVSKELIYKINRKGLLAILEPKSYRQSCNCINDIYDYFSIDSWSLSRSKAIRQGNEKYPALDLCGVDEDNENNQVPQTYYVPDDAPDNAPDNAPSLRPDDAPDDAYDDVPDETPDETPDKPSVEIADSSKITGGGDTNNVTLLLIICVVLILLHFMVKKPAFFIAALLAVVIYSKLVLYR